MRVSHGVHDVPLSPRVYVWMGLNKKNKNSNVQTQYKWLHSMLDVNDLTKTIFQGSLWVCNECQRTFSIAIARITSNSSVFFPSIRNFFQRFLFLLIYNFWLFCFCYFTSTGYLKWAKSAWCRWVWKLEATLSLPPPLAVYTAPSLIDQ